MKELTLKDLQLCSLEILKDVHNFCESEHLHYSLAYGTLLGAVRHKGFIPWDDDVDIYMPRPDYEKFFKAFNSCNNVAVHESESYIAFGRVCDVKKTIVKTTLPWTKSKNLGVWIDVFPIDGIGDEKNVFSQTILELDELFNKQLAVRRSLPSLFSQLTPTRMLKQVCRKIKYCSLNINEINQKIKETCLMHPYESTNYCSQLACPGNKDKEFFKKSFFEEYVELEFEGKKLKAVKDWDAVLKMNFSDYMQLPPIDQRVAHSSDHTKFYWKEK
ncbi:phosphorylcholine transferase LicD [uncultured Fibrobacter sp.]|uniref:LicD family protein n=1 Tax=uncultured Fibrobacter sp. TaxID=261512 RepID=UPI0025E7245A|nr:LicD family protein [uncultured Fibrobacter sp.]